jgi:hypothetical protein
MSSGFISCTRSRLTHLTNCLEDWNPQFLLWNCIYQKGGFWEGRFFEGILRSWCRIIRWKIKMSLQLVIAIYNSLWRREGSRSRWFQQLHLLFFMSIEVMTSAVDFVKPVILTHISCFLSQPGRAEHVLVRPPVRICVHRRMHVPTTLEVSKIVPLIVHPKHPRYLPTYWGAYEAYDSWPRVHEAVLASSFRRRAASVCGSDHTIHTYRPRVLILVLRMLGFCISDRRCTHRPQRSHVCTQQVAKTIDDFFLSS